MLKGRLGLSVSLCHSVCGVPEEVSRVRAWCGLIMDATQGSLSCGHCSKVGPEKGGTHISQASHPWGALSSDSRRCSSAGRGSGGRAW